MMPISFHLLSNIPGLRGDSTMAWSMEYAAATLTLALLVIFIFKMNQGGGLRPPVAPTMVGIIINFNRLHDFFLHHHRRHKTYRVSYPTFSYVLTTDPANVEHILRSNFVNYVKGKTNHEVLEDLLGDGIFSVDGELWRQQRKLASYEFSTKVLKDFSSVVFRENAVKLSKILLEAYRTKQTVEMQGLLLRSTMEGICKLGFGVDINSLSNTNSGSEATFAMAFDTANALVMWRYFDVAWKLKRYFNILSEANMRDNIKTVDDFVYNVIQSRKREISVQTNYVKPDILSRFIALTEKQPENYSDKYLRDIILNFMIAGRDTTAVTLCWFFHLLCKNPEVEKKLVQEIQDLIKVNECVTIEESISMFSQSLTHTVLDKMHYLHAALSETLRLYPVVPMNGVYILQFGVEEEGSSQKIKQNKCTVKEDETSILSNTGLSETLRLYPVVPMDGKHAVSDDILPDGFKVKKGDTVAYVPYSMGRMTYLWGSDAEEFKPERWLQNGIFQPQSPFKFTAFQAGPRICLGKDFAYVQMKIVATLLVRFFKFELVEGMVVRYRPSLTLHMTEDGLNLHVKPRLNC